jgi:hypothetical protein
VAVSLARRTFGLMVFVLGLTTLNTRACASVVATEVPGTGVRVAK